MPALLLRRCCRQLRTFQNQSSVPRLPIPTLEQTTTKYLRSLRPILQPAEYQQSEKAVEEFVSGIGPVLQQRLQEYDKTQPIWLDKAYLEWREPTMINVNWWVEFVDSQPVKQYRSSLNGTPQPKGQVTPVQISRAAGLVSRLLDFKELLETECLPPEYMGKKKIPLCMNQYRMQFGVTRQPARPADLIHQQFPARGRHIIVMIEDQIYKVPVLTTTGKVIKTQAIERQLWAVWELHKSTSLDGKQPAVGLLTSEQRDKWSDSYQRLLQLDGDNPATLQSINDSLFAISLELYPAAEDIDTSHRVFFYGQNGRNRWFDKSLTFIVTNNGRAGCNGEHSPSDAVIPGRIIGDILASEESGKELLEGNKASGVDLPAPQLLQWTVDEKVVKAIEEAEKRAAADIEDVDSVLLHFNDYGGDAIKADAHASPDAFVQMALQLAYYRIYKQSCPTYESASTRQYLHGRTETIRSCSLESVAFVNAFDDPAVKGVDKIRLLVDALKAHTKYTVEATAGYGCDRHLLGLRMMLKEGEKASLFTDPAYLQSMNFKLSSSNVSPGDYFYGGFGPVVLDGYGVNYAIGSKRLRFSVSSRRQSKDTCSRSFRKMLGDSLTDLMALSTGVDNNNSNSQQKLSAAER